MSWPGKRTRMGRGEVAAAVFTTHVPRLMISDPAARKAYMGRNVTTFYDAMPALELKRLRELDFDTFVLIDTHWFTTLEYILNANERLCGVYTSEELPQMLHDLEYDYRGDAELAREAEKTARACGLRAVASASHAPAAPPWLAMGAPLPLNEGPGSERL